MQVEERFKAGDLVSFLEATTLYDITFEDSDSFNHIPQFTIAPTAFVSARDVMVFIGKHPRVSGYYNVIFKGSVMSIRKLTIEFAQLIQGVDHGC